MSDEHPVPLRGTYWVVPNQFLAGEYPGEAEPELTDKKTRALISAGIRTFVDLTDEGEVSEYTKVIPAYRSILRQVSAEESVQMTYANIPTVACPHPGRCVAFLM